METFLTGRSLKYKRIVYTVFKPTNCAIIAVICHKCPCYMFRPLEGHHQGRYT